MAGLERKPLRPARGSANLSVSSLPGQHFDPRLSDQANQYWGHEFGLSKLFHSCTVGYRIKIRTGHVRGEGDAHQRLLSTNRPEGTMRKRRFPGPFAECRRRGPFGARRDGAACSPVAAPVSEEADRRRKGRVGKRPALRPSTGGRSACGLRCGRTPGPLRNSGAGKLLSGCVESLPPPDPLSPRCLTGPGARCELWRMPPLRHRSGPRANPPTGWWNGGARFGSVFSRNWAGKAFFIPPLSPNALSALSRRGPTWCGKRRSYAASSLPGRGRKRLLDALSQRPGSAAISLPMGETVGDALVFSDPEQEVAAVVEGLVAASGRFPAP